MFVLCCPELLAITADDQSRFLLSLLLLFILAQRSISIFLSRRYTLPVAYAACCRLRTEGGTPYPVGKPLKRGSVIDSKGASLMIRRAHHLKLYRMIQSLRVRHHQGRDQSGAALDYKFSKDMSEMKFEGWRNTLSLLRTRVFSSHLNLKETTVMRSALSSSVYWQFQVPLIRLAKAPVPPPLQGFELSTQSWQNTIVPFP
jgi:hypothetical protein